MVLIRTDINMLKTVETDQKRTVQGRLLGSKDPLRNSCPIDKYQREKGEREGGRKRKGEIVNG